MNVEPIMMDDTAVEYSPELPEPIIHRIQSLLNLKKAAQTTLLSKSWCLAWSTRSIIDLDESHFQAYAYSSSHTKIKEFPNFANKTFRTYEESNTRVETFKLCLKNQEWYVRSGLATDWTLKALKLGATDLTFENNHPDIAVVLDEVSGRENISSLRLQRSKINQLKVFKLPALKSLTLSNLTITRESLLNIISCCPLIENLSLISDHDYYSSDDDSSDDETSSSDGDIDEQPPQQQQHGVRSSPSTYFLHNLRSLVLCRVSSKLQIKPLFLDDLSSNFPNLKDLTLELSFSNVAYFQRKRETQIISSRSLEVLSFGVGDDKIGKDHKKEMPRFEFDVPSVRVFKLDYTSYMPNLCFTSAASMDQCESHVSLTKHGPLSIQWFRKLSKVLTELRGSKIHLCLHVDGNDSFNYRAGEVKCLNVCELENLTMKVKGFPSLSFSALLDGLFRICRPKMITQYISDNDNDNDDDDTSDDDDMSVDEAENTVNNDVVLCEELIQGMKLKSLLIPSQNMYGLRDLEELNVQKIFNGLWRPQPLDSILLDGSSGKRSFRFLLRWKPS